MEHRTEQSLKDYTSFKVGGKAKDFYIPFTIEEVQELVQEIGAVPQNQIRATCPA